MEYYKGPPILTQSNVDHFDEIFSPIADELITTNVKNYACLIIYSSLVLCGVGCAFLDGKLGDHQFYLIATP